jgi:fructose-1,6-bisphosphatase II
MTIETSDRKKDCVQTLSMDFLAVAQKAAIASGPWIGKGDKTEADRAGTEAMRQMMNLIKM